MLLERCRRILEQVGIALEHLHRKGLVHMELSLDTVMVLILICGRFSVNVLDFI